MDSGRGERAVGSSACRGPGYLRGLASTLGAPVRGLGGPCGGCGSRAGTSGGRRQRVWRGTRREVQACHGVDVTSSNVHGTLAAMYHHHSILPPPPFLLSGLTPAASLCPTCSAADTHTVLRGVRLAWAALGRGVESVNDLTL